MLANADYLELDALDLARGIRRQQFSTEDVMGCAIERARQVNPLLNAIVFANDAEAMARAQAVDQDPASLDRSPLAGLPILIKDLSDVSGLPSTYGSRLYRDYIPQGNSRIVQKYLDAGLIVLGKTNTPEKGLVITTEPVATGRSAAGRPKRLVHFVGCFTYCDFAVNNILCR